MIALPPQFNIFSQELRDEILRNGIFKTIPKGIQIIHEGQYVQSVPIVLKGLIKVVTRHEDKEFLLYYIQPNESCIMSFFGAIDDKSSKIFAQTEADSELLLLPSSLIRTWLAKFPELNLFY